MCENRINNENEWENTSANIKTHLKYIPNLLFQEFGVKNGVYYAQILHKTLKIHLECFLNLLFEGFGAKMAFISI